MALEPESTSGRPISNALDARALDDPRFEVLRALGVGASGTVYRARVKEPLGNLAVTFISRPMRCMCGAASINTVLTGSVKDAVLPVPVWAIPNRSLPSRSRGMERA